MTRTMKNPLSKLLTDTRLTALTCLVAVAGCKGGDKPADSAGAPAGAALTGAVRVDGSSTVFPITEAVAEEFQAANRGVRVTVAVSGTGGGFKKFVVGEIDINDASRHITKDEAAKAEANGIAFIELPVAYDGIALVVNPKNTFVDHLTMAELKAIWSPDSTVKTWKDVRAAWPAEPIKLYGAGTDSGTFDYFSETVNGKARACRADYSASEDDNVLAQGVAGDTNALGFFGYSYFKENKDKLRAVPIDGGAGPIGPSDQSINDGTYAPLSRPVFIYVATKALDRPEVKAFVDYYLVNVPKLAADVGEVPLPAAVYDAVKKRVAAKTVGSVFHGEGVRMTEPLAKLFGATP